MEAQDKQGDSLPTPEVIAALVDLARLAHRIEFAAPEAPGTIATLLLERLMMVCKAQRGAILFTPQRPVEHKPSIGTSALALKDTPQARLRTPRGVGYAGGMLIRWRSSPVSSWWALLPDLQAPDLGSQ